MLNIIGNRKIIMSILTVVLLIYGAQGVSYGQAADLAVTSTTVSRSSVAPGESFTISVNIRNVGGVQRKATTLNYYESTDDVLDKTDDEFIDVEHIRPIAAGGSLQVPAVTWRAPSSPGTYYYFAYVERVDGETNLDNNERRAQLTVVQSANRPDLTVSVSPTYLSVAPSSTFTLTATVRNDGNGASAATTLQFYRSTDTIITTSDTRVGTIRPVNALAARDGIQTISIPLSAPSNAGTYYYGACVERVPGETDITDDCSPFITISVTNPPDLVVDSPTVDKSTLAPGESFTLTATVRNQGGGSSNAATLRYYRSTDTTITTSDTEVGTDNIGFLYGYNTGFTRTSTQSVALTAPSDPGVYYYGACVSIPSNEISIANNCSNYVTITVTAPPDLVVDISLFRQATFAPRESFTLDATVRNQGSGQSNAAVLRYYEDTNSRFTRERQIGRVSVSAISINSSSSKSITLIAPSDPGTYYYRACVDSVTNERNTDNNCSSYVVITVAQPLSIESFQPNKFALTAGESFTLTATIKNDGNERSDSTTLQYYRSSNATVSTRDTSVGRSAISALSARATTRVSISITAPGTSGTYYYGACIGNAGTFAGNCSVVKISVVDVVIDESQRPSMYWVDGDVGTLQSLTGPNVSSLVPTVQNATGVVVDMAGGKIYWTEQTSSKTGRIRRADLNGTNVQLVKELTSVPRGLAIDTSNNKLYLANAWGKVQRLNLDGTGFQPNFIVNLNSPMSVAVDAAGGKVYWTEGSRIRRANLNGTNVQLVREFTSKVQGLAIDAQKNKLYLASAVGKVQRLNLDGTNFEPNFIVNLNSPMSVAVDAAGGKVYWTEENRIRRANLNGTNTQNVATGVGSPIGITLSSAAVEVLISQAQRPPIYWHTGAGILQRLTGAEVQGIAPAAQNTTGIAVDARGGKVYWTEQTGPRTGRIRRANLNGTNIQLVKELTSVPRGLAIDTSNNKLYLTNTWGKVQRLNLDGTGFQPNLIINLQSPMRIVVDAAGGKIYWTEKTGDQTARIRRANLNGTNVQLVRALTSVPHGLAIDTSNGKLYITNAWGKVQRMNLAGTGFQPNFIVNLQSPQGVTVDIAAKKVYWTERSKIRRANLDGSNIQDVATGLGGPAGIALGIAPVNATAAAPAAAAAIPNETVLHPNYPNPFNPETWIPYQLQKSTDVQVSIYNQSGVLVRELSLGYQEAGQYVSRSRAAYWDGRNQVGEPVASGLYFYTLTADDFSATRKMLILK